MPSALTAVICWTLAAIFFFLSGVHVYWLLRRGRSFGAFVPTAEGRPVMSPGPVSTVVVALLLLAAALVVLRQGGIFELGPARAAHLGTWSLAAIFLLRAIGDFRYVGFFKRVRGTPFAQNDSRYFSPLCLLISFLAFGLAGSQQAAAPL